MKIYRPRDPAVRMRLRPIKVQGFDISIMECYGLKTQQIRYYLRTHDGSVLFCEVQQSKKRMPKMFCYREGLTCGNRTHHFRIGNLPLSEEFHTDTIRWALAQIASQKSRNLTSLYIRANFQFRNIHEGWIDWRESV